MQIHVLHHVMNHDCFEKYLDSEKKRYFFQNQKIGCQVRGEATLYYILKKTDIKFGRGDCEWRVGSILSTQYPYLGLKSQY